MSSKLHRKRILGLDLHNLSFGFAILEDRDTLLDWGVKSFRPGTNSVKIPFPQKVARLLDEVNPKAIVLRAALGVRLDQNVRTISSLANARGIRVRMVSHDRILQTFPDHRRNKHEIALFLAVRFPELAEALPPRPKPWRSEHYRTSIFEALAASLTYFGTGKSAVAPLN
jgi:hypothetical protein